jgi:hypothetical protein
MKKRTQTTRHYELAQQGLPAEGHWVLRLYGWGSCVLSTRFDVVVYVFVKSGINNRKNLTARDDSPRSLYESAVAASQFDNSLRAMRLFGFSSVIAALPMWLTTFTFCNVLFENKPSS